MMEAVCRGGGHDETSRSQQISTPASCSLYHASEAWPDDLAKKIHLVR